MHIFIYAAPRQRVARDYEKCVLPLGVNNGCKLQLRLRQ